MTAQTIGDKVIPRGFERVNCPGCGADKYRISRVGRDWALDESREISIVCCESCGLNFTNPRPDESHLGEYYTAEYAPYQRQRGEINRQSGASTSVRTWVLARAYGSPASKPRGWRGQVATLVNLIKPAPHFGFGIPFHGNGRLLDFGCGNGTFLRRMSAIGWDATGIDMSSDAVAAVIAGGNRALHGSLPHPEFPLNWFDVVTMRSSLEHVGEPRQVLAAARDLLRAGGRLVIQVPNFASWEIDYFGDAALSLDLPRHLLHFTPPTLADLISRCGFKSVEVKQISRAGGLRKSLGQIERRGSGRGLDRWLRIKPVCQFVAMRAGRAGRGNELIATAVKE